MMDDPVQTGRAPGGRSQNAIGKPLGEYLPAAEDRVAPKAPSYHGELHVPTRQRQIIRSSPVVAMNAPCNRAARRACTEIAGMPDGDDRPLGFVRRTLHYKTWRNET